MNPIQAYFNLGFRIQVVGNIKSFGIGKTEQWMLDGGFHPAFVKAIIKNVIRKEGW